MKKLLLISLLLAVAAILVVRLYPGNGERGVEHVEGLPWQIQTLPDGNSKVFGLRFGRSTLGDAMARFGKDDMKLAIIADPGEPGTLEMYYSQMSAGVLTGKMVLGAVLDRQTLEGMEQRAVRSKFLGTGARQFILNPADLPAAYQAPIGTITFIPSAKFDEKTALHLFGAPQERIRIGKHVQHLLYPAKGVDIIINAQGKNVLQYVAPRQFERLRTPLIKAAQPKPAGH
ncbi:MAG: hypothetical protein WCC36_13640 [Gammaproteobacteria bacterium]